MDLKNEEEAMAYLTQEMERGEKEFFLALYQVIKSRWCISHFAKQAGLCRGTIHRLKMGRNSLEFGNIQKILNALGFRLEIHGRRHKEV